MCGLFGDVRYYEGACPQAVSLSPSSILASLRHRGPDGHGSLSLSGPGWISNLIHTRLKIIDLSERAAQPMASPDDRFHIAFNGEIYNYSSLRLELQRAGRVFRSQSDTEVLLAALESWGEGALPRLDGIFGFILLDRSDGSLLVARDAFGVKPVYYSVLPDGVAVCSELRCLARTLGLAANIDHEGVARFLAFGSVYGPTTILEGINELLPGHLLRANRQGLELKQWFALPAHVNSPSRLRRDAETTVGALLADAVHRQLASDVPVGIFTSSGMDSNAILALASRHNVGAITAMTVAFDDDFDTFNEHRDAERFARLHGVRHEVLRLRGGWVLENLDAIIAAMDQPSMDGVNTWAISRAVKNAGITVAISGLGADEVFGGYPHLHDAYRHSRAVKALRTLGPLTSAVGTALGFLGDWNPIASKAAAVFRHIDRIGGIYAVRRALFLPENYSSLVRPEVARVWARSGIEGLLAGVPLKPLESAQEATILEFHNYLPFTLLRDTDAMSMAHSLEVRVPFLDRALVEYVLSLPLDMRFAEGQQKPLLAAAVPEIASLALAKKRGFTLPFERWLDGPLRPMVQSRLATLPYAGRWIRPDGASRLFKAFLAGNRRLWSRVWAIYVLDRWLESIDHIASPDTARPAHDLARHPRAS